MTLTELQGHLLIASFSDVIFLYSCAAVDEILSDNSTSLGPSVIAEHHV